MTPDDELRISQATPQPLLVRIPAMILSYVFHPLFIPAIGTWYLIFVQPGYFTGMPPHDKVFTLLRVAVNTIVFPGATVLLLKALGFSKSIFLRTQRERIGPYVASNIFYFWIYLVLRSQHEIPLILTGFIFGIFLASSVGLIVNSFFKISMHGLGMGSLSGLMLWIIFTGPTYSIFPAAMVVFILSGAVSTSRLIVGDHEPLDLYYGLFFGIICQFIAAGFVNLA
jgi:hypothetical protein